MKTIIFIFVFYGILHSQISRSYSQVMYKLGSSFDVKQSSNVKGIARYMGNTKNYMANIEIIGNKNNIKSATILIGLPNDNESVRGLNLLYAIRFLKNVSSIKNPIKWIGDSVKSGSGKYKGSNCNVTLTIIKGLGMVLITAE